MLKKVLNLKLPLRTAAIDCGQFGNCLVKAFAGGTQSVAAMSNGFKGVLNVVILLALLFTANVSHGFAVLWWAVGQDATVTDENNNTTVFSKDYAPGGETIDAARIRVTGNGVNMILPLYVRDGNGGWEVYEDGKYTDEFTRPEGDWQSVSWAAAHVDLGGDTSQYKFVIELGSVDDTYSWQNTLAVSSPASFSELMDHYSSGSVEAQSQSQWMVNAFTAVPEPSVAMLLLLGVELLAFRRGRRKSVM